jgi:malate dehydrogenase
MRKKIALVGAGNIGGTIALLAGLKDLADITLIDVAEGLPEGKGLDLSQVAPIMGFNARIHGTNDMAEGLQGADAIVVTAGLARKPGMSRDDLLKTNAEIIKSIAHQIRDHAPEAFVVVVTNPLDAMVWVMQQESGLPPHKVVGMAGILDSARFRSFLAAEFNVSVLDVRALVLGGHGDTMVPLLSHSSVGGINLEELVHTGSISAERLEEIIERTRQGGVEIVNHLKTGSAFFAPAAAALEMVEAYLKDQKRILPCAAYLSGEYGAEGIYVGVPVILGGEGVEEIIELALTEEEQESLTTSIKAVQTLIERLDTL